MFKKVIASFATLLLAAGLSVVAVAAPASAHNADLSGVATCQADGTYSVTWTGTLTNYGDHQEIDIKVIKHSPSGSLINGVDGQVWLFEWTEHYANHQLPAWPTNGVFTYTQSNIPGTATSASTAYQYDWKNGPSGDPETTVTMAGDCAKQSTADAAASITVHPATCESAATLEMLTPTFATWGSVTGTYTVVATAIDGHKFPAGDSPGVTVSGDGKTKTFTGSLNPKKSAQECLNQDASVSVSTTGATCSAAEKDVVVTATHATYVVTYPTATTWKVTATADATHLFGNGETTKVIDGTFAPQQTQGCDPPKCLPKSAVTYTYLPATNNGVIKVVNPNPAKYTNELCAGFWVTATSWNYTSSTLWPQVRNQNNPLPKITTVGEYPYAATVGCGQGDIYASFTESPYVGTQLFGPNNPFAEKFLHEMGFAGPQPTWMYTAFGCNDAPVATPTAQAISVCGTYGSVSVPADTAKIDYTLTGNGTTGINTVTAVAISPYVLKDYPVGGWSFNLGTYTDCVRTVTIAYVPDCAVGSTANWIATNPGTVNVTLTLPGGGTHVATPGTSSFTTAPTSTLTVTWGGAGSGVAPGSATAAASDLPANDPKCKVDADVKSIHDKCTYTADGKANLRTASITFDNTRSARSVLFEIVGYPQYTQTVPAGQKVTLNFTDLGPIGGKYVVKAGGETFTLTLPTCVEPVKPAPKSRFELVSAYNCDSVLATITTTKYTTDWVFNTTLVKWIEGPEVAGTPVVTTRALTPQEAADNECIVVITDPVASTCLVQSPDTDFGSWIRVALNDNVEYHVDGVLATTEFIEVAPGTHTVTADALNGFTLSGGSPDVWTDTHHEWEFTAVDFATQCQPQLTGSTAAGECIADAPWIFFTIQLTDPAGIATSDQAHLIMADGTNTKDILLGTVGADGTLTGKILWPGAAVAADGVTPIAWPGWEQTPEGEWVETTGNYAWTRVLSEVTLSVNPSLVVPLEYPPATPECATSPEPPTLAVVTPQFSYEPLTCTTTGSYTVGELTAGTIAWTVNGKPISAGTYPVTGPQTLTFVASPMAKIDGLDPDWVQPAPITFSAGSEPCSETEVAALAMTGVTNSYGLIFIGLLFALTGVGLYLARRRTATEE